MLFASLTERGAAPALEKTLVFHEARLKMIAENVANWNTPGYRAKQLDASAFQHSLCAALERREGHANEPLRVRNGDQVDSDDEARLLLTPSELPVENVLLHDGTNLSIETQMADLAQTGLSHSMASTLLRGHFEGLRRAIRGV